jgi:hypothetical protein
MNILLPLIGNAKDAGRFMRSSVVPEGQGLFINSHISMYVETKILWSY